MRKNRGDFDNIVKDNILIGSSRSRKLNCLKRGSIVYLGDYRTVKYMSLFMNTNSLKRISNIFNKFYFDGNIFKSLDISDIEYSSCFLDKNEWEYGLSNEGYKIWFVNNLVDENYDDEIIGEKEKFNKLKESFDPKKVLGNLEFKINSGSLSRIFFYNQSANYNAMIYSKSVYGIIAAPFCFINLFEKIYDLIEMSKLTDFINFDKRKSSFEILSNYIILSILLSNYNLAKKIKDTNLYGSNLNIVFGSEINEGIEDYIPELNSIFIYKNYKYNSENHTNNGNDDILKYVFPKTKYYISRLLKSLKILKYLSGEGFNLDRLLSLNEEFLLDENKIKIDEYSKVYNLFSRWFYSCRELVGNERLIKNMFSKDCNKNTVSKLKLKESIIIYNFLSTLYNFEPNIFCNNPKELFYSLDINRENTINAGRKCMYLNFDSSRLNDYTSKVINDISKKNKSLASTKRNKTISNYNYFKPFITIVNSNKILRYNSESMASELELTSYHVGRCENKNSQLNLMSRYYDSIAKHNVAFRDNSDNSIASYNTEDHIKFMYLYKPLTLSASSFVDSIEPFNTNFVFSIDKEAIIRSLIEDKISKKIDHKCSILKIKSLFDLFNYRYEKLSNKLKINSNYPISKFIEICDSCFTKYINKILIDSNNIIELLVGSILLPSYRKILNINCNEKSRVYKNTDEMIDEFLKLEDEFKNKKSELIMNRFNKNFKLNNSSFSYLLDEYYENIMYSFKFVRFLIKLISKLKVLTEDKLLYFNKSELKRLENVFEIVLDEEGDNPHNYKVLFTDMITILTPDFNYGQFKSIELYHLFRVRSIFKIFMDKRRAYYYERMYGKGNLNDFTKKLLCFEKGGNIWSTFDYLNLPTLYIIPNKLYGKFGNYDAVMYNISLSLKIRISLLIRLYMILTERKHKKSSYAGKLFKKLLNDHAKKQSNIYNMMFYHIMKDTFRNSIDEKICRLVEDDLRPFIGINEKDCNYKTVTCQNIKMSLLDNRHNLNIQYRNLYKKFRKILNSYKFSIKIKNSEQLEEIDIN
ncbi:MAG: hypothetical protein QW727_04130 [Candidatus Pacearchaeota archaeon]